MTNGLTSGTFIENPDINFGKTMDKMVLPSVVNQYVTKWESKVRIDN